MNKAAGTAIAGAIIAAAAVSACSAPAGSGQGSCTAAMRSWYAGDGKARLSLVQGDLEAITGHASNGMAALLTADGAKLAKDAITAQALPLPCDATDYNAAMQSLAAAGADLALGNVSKSVTEVSAAQAPLSRAITALDKVLGQS